MTATREQVEAAYRTARRSDAAGRLIGVSPTQFKRLMHRYGLPFLPRSEQDGRGQSWQPSASRDLAYLLGVLIGDGHVKGRQRSRANSFRIELQVTDRVFAEKFHTTLTALGLRTRAIREVQDKRPNRKLAYRAWAQHKRFALWYRSLTLEEITTWSKGHEEALVCGIWESEGHVIPEGDHFDLTVGMTREDVIDLLVSIATAWGYHPKKNGPYKDRRGTKDTWRFSLFRKEETSDFIQRINPCIRRSPRQSRAKQRRRKRRGRV